MPRIKRECGLCGKTTKLVKTKCCNNWICDSTDLSDIMYSDEQNCLRNHNQYSLCAEHKTKKHQGAWQKCEKCKEGIETELYVWYGTNDYNFEKLKNPPPFEPKKCKNCSKTIQMGVDGYLKRSDGEYFCEWCEEIGLAEFHVVTHPSQYLPKNTTAKKPVRMTRAAQKKVDQIPTTPKHVQFDQFTISLGYEEKPSFGIEKTLFSPVDGSVMKRSQSMGAKANRKKPIGSHKVEDPKDHSLSPIPRMRRMETRAKKVVQQPPLRFGNASRSVAEVTKNNTAFNAKMTRENNRRANNGKKRKAETSLNNRGMETQDKGSIGFRKKRMKWNERQRSVNVTDPSVTIIINKYTNTNQNNTPIISTSTGKMIIEEEKQPTPSIVEKIEKVEKKQPNLAPAPVVVENKQRVLRNTRSNPPPPPVVNDNKIKINLKSKNTTAKINPPKPVQEMPKRVMTRARNAEIKT